MSNLHFNSPVYHPSTEDDLLGGSGSGKEQITAATGFTKMANYGIGAQGSGASVIGNIGGTLKGHDYKAIYKVYNVKTSDSAGVWVFKYQHDTSRDELKKVDENSREVALGYNMQFILQGNDFNITSVFIYYSTIQLKTDSTTKQYIVTNDNSASASDPQGNPYSGFKPVAAAS